MKNQKQSRNQTGYTLLIAAFVAVGLMGSCSPKSAVTGTKVMTADYLAQGKIVFDNSCGKCHDLPNPADHSAQNWVGIMNSMAPKAKLNDAQHQMVYDYIVSVK